MYKVVRDASIAIVWGGIGLVVAVLLKFPAPFLTGPALIVSLACLAGIKMSIPSVLRDTCFIFIGIGMGTSVTPDVIDNAIQWPIGIIILIILLF